MGLLQKIFGSHSDHELKRIYPIVDKIDKWGEKIKDLSTEELRAKTDEFRARYDQGESLDDMLPEAFAVAREMCDRILGMRPFKVQLIGGIVLHQGRIAEMKTGEGKTLVAVLPAYLNAITGEGVHIVTVNDYLARRDSEWMGKVYQALGMTVGLIVHDMSNEERKAAYAADITYGTNNEMGFDYLRDNMAIYKEQMVQRGHAFAIVDEVDSILIDEARTPLIISGEGDESTDLYRQADDFVCTLKKKVYASIDEKLEEDEAPDIGYVVDEKARSATLTATGIAAAEKWFNLENLADVENAEIYHHINQALKAHGVMKNEVDYVVKDGEIIIVDEFTGRLMIGRRYSEGLHQAIEAKERVIVQKENKTLATITFQNFFRLYGKLSGMTGTALTEEDEFAAIYNLDIIEIPTNKPVQRIDHPDVVYKTDAGKNRAIIEQIKACHAKGQPVLVGTVSIEKSEYLAKLLKREGIERQVLNAKHHEKEAEIVAQAGKLGAVTIATNMAGRGTDIVLGGNADFLARADLRKAGYDDEVISQATGYGETDDEEILAARALYAEKKAEHQKDVDIEAEKVRAAGGLFIIGTERHESRRIDNQLRGRSGRQGDPGESRFFIAMTDDVMRLFGSDRMQGMMDTLGVDEDTPLDAKMLSNAIEQAQRTVEGRNFQARKNTLEFDDVMNVQRNVIYGERRKVLDGEDIQDQIQDMIREVVSSEISSSELVHDLHSQAAVDSIVKPFRQLFLRSDDLKYSEAELKSLTQEKLISDTMERAKAVYAMNEEALGTMEDGTVVMRELERVLLLRVVDEYWMDHIDAMHELRQGIGLRGYSNIKPVDAYKQEGFEMFEAMTQGIREETVRRVYLAPLQRRRAALERKSVVKKAVANVGGDDSEKKKPVRVKKVKPNDPCPCGAKRPDGRPWKYKECCGRK